MNRPEKSHALSAMPAAAANASGSPRTSAGNPLAVFNKAYSDREVTPASSAPNLVSPLKDWLQTTVLTPGRESYRRVDTEVRNLFGVRRQLSVDASDDPSIDESDTAPDPAQEEPPVKTGIAPPLSETMEKPDECANVLFSAQGNQTQNKDQAQQVDPKLGSNHQLPDRCAMQEPDRCVNVSLSTHNPNIQTQSTQSKPTFNLKSYAAAVFFFWNRC